MKIAIPTDDGVTVSAHLGEARYMLVATIESGQLIDRTLRELGDSQQIHLHDHAEGHHHAHHHARFARVADCDMLVGRGMGQPAYERLQAMGLQVITPDLKRIDDVLQAVLQNTLQHNPRRIHASHHH